MTSMHLMIYWYSDSSWSCTIKANLLQEYVAFRSSKYASKYWRSWLSDRFSVLSSTFLRVSPSNTAYTAYIFWFLIPASCILSIWCMKLTYASLYFWFASPIWPLIFGSFLNKLALIFGSRRMGEKLLPWLSLSALLSAPLTVFYLFSFWEPCAISWSHCRTLNLQTYV